MPRRALTPKQTEFLSLLAVGLSPTDIRKRMGGISRDRYNEYLNVLRKTGYIVGTPTEQGVRWQRHPQDSTSNPWPPPARIVRIKHPETGHDIVIRAVLLPREENTDAIPDEKVVHVSDRTNGQCWCWSASRRQRWTTSATRRALSHPGAHYDPTITPRGMGNLTKSAAELFAQEIAWALDVEAVLDDPPIADITKVQPVNSGAQR